jgi:spermidine synthase
VTAEVRLHAAAGEETLYLGDSQAMQAWEADLMRAAADMLCDHGTRFLEAGLGFGFSALRIASAPRTREHVVVELHDEVIRLFQERCPDPPPTLRIVHGDFFDVIAGVEPESLDGIFFDPALPLSVWEDEAFSARHMPVIASRIAPGGVFIPFFATQPVIRWQYVDHFDSVYVVRRPYHAYEDTVYTHGREGFAYLQCFQRGEHRPD